jgi:pyroglutamyl-peptidase
MKKLLLFGFDRFLSYSDNPSKRIVEKLNQSTIADCKVVGAVLPVEHKTSALIAEKRINEEKPDVIMEIALAAGRGCITLERVALNRYYFVDTDKIVDESLAEDGAVGYLSTLPLERIKRALENEGIPAEYSFWADTYVSNEVFYHIMRAASRKKIKAAGMIHLPLSAEQVIQRKLHYMVKSNMPSMQQPKLEEAVKLAIGICIRNIK